MHDTSEGDTSEFVADVVTVAGEGGVGVSHVAPGSRATASAVVLLATSALIFSTGGLFVRNLDHPHTWTTVFWRSASAAATLLGLIAWRARRNTWRSIATTHGGAWAVAAAFAVSSIAMVVALSRTSVAVVLVIFALGPLAAAVLAWLLIGERVHGYTWFAITVTVAGVAYMVSGPGAAGSASGALIAGLIPLAFGFGTVMIRRHADVAMAPAMLLAALISVVVSIPFARPFDVSGHDLVLMILFGGAQLGVGLAIFSIGAARAPATEVALLSMLEPVAGPIWVWIFLSEYPGMPALIGGSIVFIALATHTLYAAKQPPVVAAPTRVEALQRP